jgi:hypothetical protein
MSCIVYQTNHKTGIKYAYESVSYWDKDKGQPRSKRKYIGRVDPETGEIIQKKDTPSHSGDKGKALSSEITSLREKLKEKDMMIAVLREEIKEKDAAYKKLSSSVKKVMKAINSEFEGV